MRLIWSPQAVEDVEAIRSYVARDSEHYANLLAGQTLTVRPSQTRRPGGV